MNGIKILNQGFQRGRVTHALFDFDGTISLIRYGWEEVMQDVMEEMICGEAGSVTPELRREISEYIDVSTGILTIYQMKWLVKAVTRWKLAEGGLTAGEYKRIYNERLLERKVDARLAGSTDDESKRRLLLRGAGAFLERLSTSGVELILASGTDDIYVQREASFLGVDRYFQGRIHGALEDTQEYSKENIIHRILEDEIEAHAGSVMAVFGDGPVEIRAAKEYGALAIGVASNEEAGRGWNPRKVKRLTDAGADILIPDFSDGSQLLSLVEGQA